MWGFRTIFMILLVFAGSTSILAISGLVAAPLAESAVSLPTAATTTATVTTTATTTTTTATTTMSSTSSTEAQSATQGVPYNYTTTPSVSSSGNNLSNSLGALAAISSNGGSEPVLATAQRTSLFLAPAGWIMVVGAWIWRGRVRARWRELGFESDVFDLFMKMKGGATRIRLLNALDPPKDRLQVAQQLGLDWKTVDRHVQVLSKYGFIHEQATFGTLKVYEVTPLGRMLLRLFDELDEASKARLTAEES